MRTVKKVGIWLLMAIVLFVPVLITCGGGGSDPNAPQILATITGVASKGLIANGAVAVYMVNEGGEKVTPALAEGTPRRTNSLLASPQPRRYEQPWSCWMTTEVAVIPLAEIAVRLAEASLGGLIPNNIAVANEMLSQLLGVSGDIITTQPVDPENSEAFANAIEVECSYTLLLAAISQMAENGGDDVDAMDIIQSFKAHLEAFMLGDNGEALLAALEDLLEALIDFIGSEENMTGATDPGALGDTLETIIREGFDLSDSYSYSWVVGEYGQCRTTCGIGSQTRTIECIRSDGDVVADDMCSGTKPEDRQWCSNYDHCIRP